MQPAQAVESVFAEIDSRLAFELVGEEAAAHADLAMDAPDGEVDAFAVESLLPRQHVLVDAVHQRPIEIEQKYGLDAHRPGSSRWHRGGGERANEVEGAMAPVRASVVNRNPALARPATPGQGFNRFILGVSMLC